MNNLVNYNCLGDFTLSRGRICSNLQLFFLITATFSRFLMFKPLLSKKNCFFLYPFWRFNLQTDMDLFVIGWDFNWKVETFPSQKLSGTSIGSPPRLIWNSDSNCSWVHVVLSVLEGSLYYQPKQCIVFLGNPQNCHRFAACLIPPKMGPI